MPPRVELRVPSQDRLLTDSIDVHTEVVIDQPNSGGSDETGRGEADEMCDCGVGTNGAALDVEDAEEVEASEDHADVVCLEAEGLKSSCCRREDDRCYDWLVGRRKKRK